MFNLNVSQFSSDVDVFVCVCVWLQVPMAKASILWLVGEYCSLVPKMGPDVLRKAAKNFVNEVHPLFNHPSLATSFLLLPSPIPPLPPPLLPCAGACVCVYACVCAYA